MTTRLGCTRRTTRLHRSELASSSTDFDPVKADRHLRNSEYSNHKNNSAMTNGAIAVTLRNAQNLASILGKETPSNWTDIANNITILVDPSSNILLEFDGFNGTTAVKQADVRPHSFTFGEYRAELFLFRRLSSSPILSSTTNLKLEVYSTLTSTRE